MSRPDPPFAFGQTVFVAWAHSHAQVEAPCPVCFGKRFVTIILGNGQHQPIECEGCALGYEGPRGVVKEWRAMSGIREGEVTGLEWDDYGGRWAIKVGGSHETSVFATREEAELHRASAFAEAERNAEAMRIGIEKSKRKSHAWHVRYHREQLAEAERRADYHRKKLSEKP